MYRPHIFLLDCGVVEYIFPVLVEEERCLYSIIKVDGGVGYDRQHFS